MKNIDKQEELFDKIKNGLKKVRERIIEFKKQKSSEIVIMEKGQIVRIKPE